MGSKAIVPVLFIVCMCIMVFSGLSQHNAANNPQNVTAVADAQSRPDVGLVIDFENGVWYFGETGANFGKNLSVFIKDHSDLEVVSISIDGPGGYGNNQGYFVVTREKSE